MGLAVAHCLPIPLLVEGFRNLYQLLIIFAEFCCTSHELRSGVKGLLSGLFFFFFLFLSSYTVASHDFLEWFSCSPRYKIQINRSRNGSRFLSPINTTAILFRLTHLDL